jgi:hypothetical protein
MFSWKHQKTKQTVTTSYLGKYAPTNNVNNKTRYKKIPLLGEHKPRNSAARHEPEKKENII